MELVAEKEKLKLRIHKLQSELQQKDAAGRQNEMSLSEGYQALVYKH